MRKALGALAVAAVWAGQADAQRSNTDHWRVIEGLLRDAGGIAKAPTAPDNVVAALAGQLRQRAQFYRDLADYQAVLARDHALLRDSIGRATGATVAATGYFRGRALQELGQRAEAIAAYRSVGAGAPANIRALAAQWSATLASGGARTWQQELVEWRGGQKKTTVSCPDAVIACALFKAILEDDAANLYRLQRSVLSGGLRPDYVAELREDGKPFGVEFYDPLVLSMLSVADYALAAYVLSEQRSAGASAVRGLVMLRAGRVAEATPLLRAGGASVAPYLGEALARSGARSEAEEQWKGATGGTLNIVWDVRSQLALDAPGMLRQFRSDSALGLGRYKQSNAGGSYLARALLRHQLPKQALTVIDLVVPEAANADMYVALPSDNVLLSRARYEVGRSAIMKDLFPLARGPIAKLAGDYPIAQPTLSLLQQLTQVPNIGDNRSR